LRLILIPQSPIYLETDDLLGLNQEQETELADLLEEDGGIDLFESSSEGAESFATRFSNMFKDFFKSADKYEGEYFRESICCVIKR
jgi:hypothetical protein